MHQEASDLNSGYEYYRQIFSGRRFPLAYVDLDLLDQNAQIIKQRAGQLPIRLASKSIRSISLIKYLLDLDPQFRGIMSFSAEEAAFLSKNGFDDILIAYPSVNSEIVRDVARELQRGKYLNLMVDDPEHVENLNNSGRENDTIIPISVDIDVSVDFPGLHFGVWRSPIRSLTQLHALLNSIEQSEFVRLDGVMGYESQIAGVTDQVKGQPVMNSIKRLLKKMSLKKIEKKRQQAVALIEDRGWKLKFVNGGGTGSIESTVKDKCVTEVTAGSGFYNSHLFDNYSNFRLHPAAGFACEINRIPNEGIYTCSGGGYIASGAIEKLKAPLPFLPREAKLTENEGAGEVQSPILYSGNHQLNIGDPIFFRHGKAGELCERFNEIYLVQKGQIEKVVKTYRGDGQCFL
jgi:D-serine deaminase-like pyridoxal phosphate-dependent protein